MTVRRAAAVLLATAALAACGVKAPPRPPIREAPGAVPAAPAPAPGPEPEACEDGCGPAPSTSTTTTTKKTTP